MALEVFEVSCRSAPCSVQLCPKFISRKSLELGGRIDGSNLRTRVLMLASLSSQLESFMEMQSLTRESRPAKMPSFTLFPLSSSPSPIQTSQDAKFYALSAEFK